MWMCSGHLNRVPPDGPNLRIPFSHSSGKVQDQRVAGLLSSEVSLLGLHTLAASSHGRPSLCMPLVSLHLLKGPPLITGLEPTLMASFYHVTSLMTIFQNTSPLLVSPSLLDGKFLQGQSLSFYYYFLNCTNQTVDISFSLPPPK